MELCPRRVRSPVGAGRRRAAQASSATQKTTYASRTVAPSQPFVLPLGRCRSRTRIKFLACRVAALQNSVAFRPVEMDLSLKTRPAHAARQNVDKASSVTRLTTYASRTVAPSQPFVLRLGRCRSRTRIKFLACRVAALQNSVAFRPVEMDLSLKTRPAHAARQNVDKASSVTRLTTYASRTVAPSQPFVLRLGRCRSRTRIKFLACRVAALQNSVAFRPVEMDLSLKTRPAHAARQNVDKASSVTRLTTYASRTVAPSQPFVLRLGRCRSRTRIKFLACRVAALQNSVAFRPVEMDLSLKTRPAHAARQNVDKASSVTRLTTYASRTVAPSQPFVLRLGRCRSRTRIKFLACRVAALQNSVAFRPVEMDLSLKTRPAHAGVNTCTSGQTCESGSCVAPSAPPSCAESQPAAGDCTCGGTMCIAGQFCESGSSTCLSSCATASTSICNGTGLLPNANTIPCNASGCTAGTCCSSPAPDVTCSTYDCTGLRWHADPAKASVTCKPSGCDHYTCCKFLRLRRRRRKGQYYNDNGDGYYAGSPELIVTEESEERYASRWEVQA